MKRTLSLILTATILLGSMGALPVFADTATVPVISEDFETDTYRYVRVIKTQPGNLGFAEIQVMGN